MVEFWSTGTSSPGGPAEEEGLFPILSVQPNVLKQANVGVRVWVTVRVRTYVYVRVCVFIHSYCSYMVAYLSSSLMSETFKIPLLVQSYSLINNKNGFYEFCHTKYCSVFRLVGVTEFSYPCELQ